MNISVLLKALPMTWLFSVLLSVPTLLSFMSSTIWGPEFKEIAAAIRARDFVTSFEELYDKLIEYEAFLKIEDSLTSVIPFTANNTRFSNNRNSNPNNKKGNNQQHNNNGHSNQHNGQNSNTNNSANKNPNVVCQFCEKRGHSARQCYHAKKILLRAASSTANHTTTSASTPTNNWLMDSAASHHVTTDLSNLSLKETYEGLDDIVIGDDIVQKREEMAVSSQVRNGATSFDPDHVRLQELGYKQELKRDLSVISSFAFSFTIISVLTGITTLYNTGLTFGGPVVLVYGWFIASFFTMFVGLSMSEICSSYPTSGSLYYWTAKLAGPNWAPFASWLTGW
ncbi:hypothetical protein HHK36_030012 [Tetracentron sinense]|uniref:Uncharacterized protein n=1 Tax=Tetracentron sinense TaxID=13715 RepID=A0A834YBW3_TETSI|nr:hypothetical protein HHK36_030012 [Tetracentron sinense]